jgi:alginate O-acetyltransferase complex protein AlgI
LTLGLTAILVFGLGALAYGTFVPNRWRAWALLAGSVIAVYWLQTPLTPRFADFILPTITIGLAVAAWWLSRPRYRALAVGHDDAGRRTLAGSRRSAPNGRVYMRDDWLTLFIIITIILALSLFRYVDPAWRLTASRPPTPLNVVFGIAEAGLLLAALALILVRLPQRAVLTLSIIFMTALFVVVKWPPALRPSLVGGAASPARISAWRPRLIWSGWVFLCDVSPHPYLARPADRHPARPLVEDLPHLRAVRPGICRRAY